MKVSFLISASAFQRLEPAAIDRGWHSDPDYALRTAHRLLDSQERRAANWTGAADMPDLDVETAARLAAMGGEFPASKPDEIARAIARFFGERPPRLEVEGVEYRVGPMLGTLSPLPN
jgi:hypothetical protein